MEEEFELPVKYKGERALLNASLLISGYTHKFNETSHAGIEITLCISQSITITDESKISSSVTSSSMRSTIVANQLLSDGS